MQKVYAYLYQNQLDVFTTSIDSWTQERYRKVYNRNLKVYRDIDNSIDFQIRNSDQKTFNASGSAVVFNLVNESTDNLVLQKDCVAVDASIGRFRLEISKRELHDLEQGFYRFSLVKEVRQNLNENEYIISDELCLYIDSQYGVHGILEVAGSISTEVRSSTEITKFERIDPSALGEEGEPYFYSSLISANPYIENPSSNHTFQIYPAGYTGEVVLQGSLDDGASPYNWTDLETVNPANSSESFFINYTGKYNWFRIEHYPQSGTIDKILYR